MATAKKLSDYYTAPTTTGTVSYDTSAGAAAYDDLYNQYAAAADKSTAQKIADSNASYTQKLREAYIKNEQDKRALQKSLTESGIRGGATETSNLKLATNYGSTRNSLNTEQAKAERDINSENETNKLNYKLQNDAAKMSYIEGVEAEARQAAREDARYAVEDAQWAASQQYNLDRDAVQDTQQEFENQLAQQQWQAQQDEAAYSQKYQQYLSAYSTKSEDTLKKLKKKMKENGNWDVTNPKCQALSDALASKQK